MKRAQTVAILTDLTTEVHDGTPVLSCCEIKSLDLEGFQMGRLAHDLAEWPRGQLVFVSEVADSECH